MKIRTGFVSNSSSMAFILIFDKPVETAKELRKLLFGERQSITYNYDSIAEYIFKDLGEPNNWETIMREMDTKLMCNEIYGDYEDKYYKKWKKMIKWQDPKARTLYALHHIKTLSRVRKLFIEYVKEYDLKNKFSYIVEYEDGYGDMYYHNGVPFEDIDSISISHH